VLPLAKQKPQPQPQPQQPAPSAEHKTAEQEQESKKKRVPTIQGGVRMVSGMVWFSSLADVKIYIQGLLDMYRSENEKATEFVAAMYRNLAEQGSHSKNANTWAKVGSLLVNSEDPERGKMEAALQLLTDMKPLVQRTEDALANFVRLEDVSNVPDCSFVLCLRYGLPERLILESNAGTEKFTLTDEYMAI